MTRLGDTCISSSYVDGSTWSEVRRDTITMGAAVDIGLAITSHQQGTSATAVFSEVSLVEASSSNN